MSTYTKYNRRLYFKRKWLAEKATVEKRNYSSPEIEKAVKLLYSTFENWLSYKGQEL